VVERLSPERITAQPEDHPEPTHHAKKNTTTVAILPGEAAPKPSRKPVRGRRKLCLDDIVEQTAEHQFGGARTGGLEDTFMFGLKPKKRESRRKPIEAPIPETAKHTSEKPKARGGKSTKAKQQVDDHPDPATEPIETVVPETWAEKEALPEISKHASTKAPAKGRKLTKTKQLAEDKLGTATEPIEPVALEAKLEEESLPVTSKKAPAKGRKTTNSKEHTEDKLDIATEPIKAVVPEVILEEEVLPVTTKQALKKTPSKTRKLTKAKPQAEDEPASDAKAGLGVPDQKPKATRKKPAAENHIETTSIDPCTPAEAPMIHEANLGGSHSGKISDVSDDLHWDAADLKSQPVIVKPETAKAKKRAIEKVVTAATPAETTKRPRRQAAINAIEKVTLGYEEELVPVDKLRRAPDGVSKARKPRRAGVLEPSVAAQSSCSTILSTSAAKDSASYDEHGSCNLPALPAETGQKTAANATESDPILADIIEQPVGVESQPVVRVSLPKLSEEETPRLRKVPSKKGRKPGVKTTTASPAAVDWQLPMVILADEAVTSAVVEPKHPGQGSSKLRRAGEDHKTNTEALDLSAKAIEKSDSLSDDRVQGVDDDAIRRHPKRTRRVLADFDGNIVRQPSAAKSSKLSESAKSPASPSVKLQSDVSQNNLRPQSKPKPKPNGRHNEANATHQPRVSPDDGPPHGQATVSKKRHVISAEEDIDWLFEAAETRRQHARPVAAVRNPAHRTRRQEPCQVAKDMDLDDLLASIAGFSGRLLAEKRGRTAV
jgi:hypothetical protein